jgi:hypothetical protein
MPSELDTHDILFNPLKKRRAEQAARRSAEQPASAESTPVPSRGDRHAPITDRPVAYAISEIADSDSGPLVSSKLIGGIAVVAAIVTAAVLMRTPALGTSADETAGEDPKYWTAAREQWADENMRVWPIVIRAGRSGALAANASKAPPSAAPGAAAVAPVANANTVKAVAAPPIGTAATPARAAAAEPSDNPYANTPRARAAAPTKASDNPYGDSPAPRARKPAAAGTDNPY